MARLAISAKIRLWRVQRQWRPPRADCCINEEVLLARLVRERLRLGVYMKMRRDRDTAGQGQVAADRASQRLARRQERNGLPRREASPVLWRDGFSEFQAMSRSASWITPSLRAELEKKTKQDLV